MELKTLKERIEKTKTVIEKKENLIIKLEKQIEKKNAELVANGFEANIKPRDIDTTKEENFNAYSVACDVVDLKERIENAKDAIEEKATLLEKYLKQLQVEQEKEDKYLYEIPSQLKDLEKELVKTWNEWDIQRQINLKAKYKEIGYREFVKTYSFSEYQFIFTTHEQINKNNIKDARALILDLLNRVKKVTGEVKSWEDVFLNGYALNGIVIGEEGTARVESILAGGYNIQRLHVRVLVHKVH